MESRYQHRSQWSMPEVLEQLSWSENDLRDVIMSGALTPSFYVNAALWVYKLDDAGRLLKERVAVHKNGWLYAVLFQQTAASDGHFRCLSETPGPVKPGSVLYGPSGNSMTRHHVVHLREVLEHGAVTAPQLNSFRPSVSAPSCSSNTALPPGERSKWWHSEYELLNLAQEEIAKRKVSGYGMVQRGSRAGKPPLKDLAEALSRRITVAEKEAGRSRTIGYKSIENYLREHGSF